jgi:WD40 repeat protein
LIEHRRVRLGSHRYDVSDLAIAQTGDAALVASADGTVREVDLIAGRVSPSWHMGDAVTAVAVSPDGTSIAAGGASGLVCLRRRADGALLQCLVGHAGPVSDLAFDPSGARLATSSWDGTVKVLSLPALAQLALLDTGGSANQLAFSPDGERIAIAMSGSPPALGPERGLEERDPLARILLWRAHRGAPAPRPLAGHQGPVTAVAWLDRTRLLSGSWDRSVRLWDSRQEREIGRAVGFAHIVRHVATDPDGRRAAAAAWAPRGEGPATVLLGLAPAP